MFKDSPAFSGFSVNDLAAAKDFYGSKLGITVEETPEGLMLKLAGNQVFIYQKDDHVPATFTILNFPVDDIDAAAKFLTGAGIQLEHYDNLGQDEDGIARGLAAGQGPDIAWFKDPAGNILSVLNDGRNRA